jgi:hypothetical protein
VLGIERLQASTVSHLACAYSNPDCQRQQSIYPLYYPPTEKNVGLKASKLWLEGAK